jgi:mono/diheme cytochrome c family protein
MSSSGLHPAVACIIRRTLGSAAIMLLAGSCAPSWNAPPVSAPLMAFSKAPVSEIERGYQIHQAQCAKCHPYEDPAHYDPVELADDIIPVMARKSKLGKADEEAVLAYLLAARRMTP